MPTVLTCHITGILRDHHGTSLPGATLRIVSRRVIGAGGTVRVPHTTEVVSDGDGLVTVDLLPGQYRCTILGGAARDPFDLVVPESAAAALVDLIDQYPALTMPVVEEVRRAAAAVEGQARDIAEAADRIALRAQISLVDHLDGTFTLSAPEQALISENTIVPWRGVELPAWHLTVGV